jgi:hypothetical protein
MNIKYDYCHRHESSQGQLGALYCSSKLQCLETAYRTAPHRAWQCNWPKETRDTISQVALVAAIAFACYSIYRIHALGRSPHIPQEEELKLTQQLKSLKQRVQDLDSQISLWTLLRWFSSLPQEKIECEVSIQALQGRLATLLEENNQRAQDTQQMINKKAYMHALASICVSLGAAALKYKFNY